MKMSCRQIAIPCLCFALLCSCMAAQAKPQDARRSVAYELDFWISNIEKEIVAAADAMPESEFGFAPAIGEFKGVRTFGEQVKHFSATNYQLAAEVLGEKPPHQEKNETAPDTVRTKAEIMDYLKGSFAYLHRAAKSITPANEDQALPAARGRTRPGLIVDALAHASNHYGQMVEYLRMNAIIPPASR
jgi:hypothetical protein